MPRVEQSEVRAIIDSDLLDISPFITAANLIVTEHLTTLGLGTGLLKEIERWLAAHFLAIRVSQDSDENKKVKSYNSKLGLDATDFGKQVKVLDSSGTMAGLGKMVVVFDVINYDD